MTNSRKIITVPLDDELRILTRFSCSGSVRGFVVGAEIMAGKTQFPRAEIWRIVSTDDDDEVSLLQRVAQIELQNQFQSSNGLYEYNISNTPLNYLSGDFFAIYQPDILQSHTVLHYTPNISSNFINYLQMGSTSSNIIQLGAFKFVTKQYVLIHLLSGML